MMKRLIAVVAASAAMLALNVQAQDCIIISEIVHGAGSGGCPVWMEITNTGTSDYTFPAGGVIVQTPPGTSDLIVDIDLTGVTISAGDSFVIATRNGYWCTGSFFGTYGFDPDMTVNSVWGETQDGEGDAALILTDTADGSHLLDIYGEFGVDGTGLPWDTTHGYSHRLPAYSSGSGGTFVASEWFLGGAESSVPPVMEPPISDEEWLQMVTTPGTHEFEPCSPCGAQQKADANCDGAVNVFDIDPFVLALTTPEAWEAEYGSSCNLLCTCDCNSDGSVNVFDIDPFVSFLTSGSY